MGRSISEGMGFRVEALTREEAASRRPMLFSAEALKTIEALREKLGRVLRQEALELARKNGRELITDDDVWEALDRIGLSNILLADADEEAVDG
jgi:histone H3/H4